jgi:hypothetical protein
MRAYRIGTMASKGFYSLPPVAQLGAAAATRATLQASAYIEKHNHSNPNYLLSLPKVTSYGPSIIGLASKLRQTKGGKI